ncbi:hypothetical protein BB497_05095 [Halomonas sp. GFAJ-1]|nr:hypothetical protein BB497_05095 [Halomonas sp. GFAJ-1]
MLRPHIISTGTVIFNPVVQIPLKSLIITLDFLNQQGQAIDLLTHLHGVVALVHLQMGAG